MKRTTLYFVLLTVLLLILFAADLLFGSVSVPLREVVDALAGGDAESAVLIRHFRLPRAITGVLAGAALACSGLLMQTMFRNPLAGPYVLGISSGASLGVSLFLMGAPLLGIAFTNDLFRSLGIIGAAWIGAAAILFMVVAVSSRIRDIMAILILGIMFGSAATAVVEILQFLSPEGAVKSFVVWTMGSLGGVSFAHLAIIGVVVGLGLLLAVGLIKPLNMLLLGENYARTTGLDMRRTRMLICLSTVLLAGTVTAFCGPIGFIGVAIPHVARMLFRNADHRVLVPGSILLGSAVMLFCDIIAQLPGTGLVLPVNTVTALLGIPIVVLVVIRNKNIL